MMDELPAVDALYNHKLKTTQHIRKHFPPKYVEYVEAEPETMQFDQTVATDKAKQETLAKDFIERNRNRMWMFSVDYVKKGHKDVLKRMLEVDNFPALMDELTFKERKLDRGSGSHNVTACMTMPKKLIKQDFRNDDWLSTPQRTSREEKMRRMFQTASQDRIKEHNRVSYFKTAGGGW